MLKTLPKREFDKLREILQPYLQHMSENKDSLLTYFFGMHKVVWESSNSSCSMGGVGQTQTRYIVIMDNLFKSFDVGNRFDMKGSFLNRSRLKGGKLMSDPGRDLNVALKDNDYRYFMKKLTFHEGLKPGALPLHLLLETDSNFLRSV